MVKRMEEKFAIPCASAIIVREINKTIHILMQERSKSGEFQGNGLIEIPGGKIRENENIFDTIRREVKEETGLSVIEIEGQNNSSIFKGNGYKVIDFAPFCCTQNLIGQYPIICMAFICRAKGNLLSFSNESQNYKWVPVKELKSLIVETPENIYPMDMAILKKFVDIYIS